MSIVYLIHFDRPIGSATNPRGRAQHYLGYTSSLARRLEEHRAGRGAAIMAAVHQQGVSWVCARTWSNGTRQLERQLKAWHKAAQLCPICSKKESL